MSTNDIKILFVRLPEAERRYIKGLVARQGLTLREAILQAFRTWELLLQSRALAAEPARATPTDAYSPKPGQPEDTAPPRQDQRPAAETPALAIDDRQAPGLSASSRVWLRRAAKLDWSKCPLAERLHGKTGNVWVVRGTDVPLAHVLQSVADGQPLLEIAEMFEITLRQLLAVVQFAAAPHPG